MRVARAPSIAGATRLLAMARDVAVSLPARALARRSVIRAERGVVRCSQPARPRPRAEPHRRPRTGHLICRAQRPHRPSEWRGLFRRPVRPQPCAIGASPWRCNSRPVAPGLPVFPRNAPAMHAGTKRKFRTHLFGAAPATGECAAMQPRIRGARFLPSQTLSSLAQSLPRDFGGKRVSRSSHVQPHTQPGRRKALRERGRRHVGLNRRRGRKDGGADRRGQRGHTPPGVVD
jgi:hypothetical protein